MDEVSNLVRCLNVYCDGTSQEINFLKSGVFFSKNIDRRTRRLLNCKLGMCEMKEEAFYLSNPMFVGKNKIKAFDFLKDKIENRLATWKGELFSFAGRATLVKGVGFTLPLYTMSIALIPNQLCKRFDAKAHQFLWLGANGNNKIPFVSWKAMCCPCNQGGLGIQSFKLINKALLANIGWALAIEENKIWVKIFKVRYFLASSFMRCRRKKTCS